ncbi:Fic family protein [Asticcacaulis sp. EMRT-3]|uniref:Fic family protein n=1 Tax=Asticcacaulis sp. EMRT-3 TaxID=3040349 RepID=UPI0024AF678B|nr:Fic family protein [Asticcacaulis sp. EMRT-3]MDI7776605.1 Fic family protein [Asticcacaulis sp. EMRT-3]
MTLYIHELDTWPHFEWKMEAIADHLAAVRHRQGLLLGRMHGLGLELKVEASLATLTEDVLKSSEIEGDILDRDQVRSSLARRLGMDIAGLVPADRHVDGIVEMMLDATQNYGAPLTEERLFSWHAALFPTGYSGMTRIVVGAWRTEVSGPMQVISGAFGAERIHYEAPAASRVAREMSDFLTWFNDGPAMDPVLKAAIAHLWFVTIHPFDDGNGRIARAIADMALARSENSPQRFYSMSAQIRQERKTYYARLEATQKSGTDITDWIDWFLACLDQAFIGAEVILADTLRKARVWKGLAGQKLSERQSKIINRLLDGFEGKLTTSKWAALTKSSPDTALRDITDLVERGILVKDAGGGRSTSYSLPE